MNFNFYKLISLIDEISVVDLLNEMKCLSSEDREVILNCDIIKNKIKNVLSESYDDVDNYFYMLFNSNLISVKELLSILDINYINNFYKDEWGKNKFFESLFYKDSNQVIEMCVKDVKLFNEIYKFNFLYLSELSYDNVLNFINLIGIINGDNYSFIRFINQKYIYSLLNEPLEDNILASIINWCWWCNKDIIQYFVLNNDRFDRLYNKIDFKYLYNEITNTYIKFSQDFLHKHINYIFNKLKDKSLVIFRYNINDFSRINGSLKLFELFDKYEDDIINSFDVESGLFNRYKDKLRNCEKIFDNKEFLDIECNDEDIDFDSYDSVISYLRELSILKLCEVVIDRLFEDNIYNVKLNIEEMIRYNGFLSNDEKVLDNDKIDFYNTILNLEKLDGNDIIKLYNELKNKNISSMFYDDINDLKNKSYTNIKSIMFNPENSNDIDSELSEKYGINIYDYRDREYTMLVRCLWDSYMDVSYQRRDCYTLLSNFNSKVLHEFSFIYGYSGFDNDCVLHIFEGDAYSGDVSRDKINSTTEVNRLMTPEQIVLSDSNISEVQIVNKENSKNKYMTLKPSYLVVYDKVSDEIVNEAHRLSIPIVIIKNNMLKYGLRGNIGFDENVDHYIYDSYDEGKRNRYGM